jgi:hypothetical protein
VIRIIAFRIVFAVGLLSTSYQLSAVAYRQPDS